MKTEDMKLIIASITILACIIAGESKSPGDKLDATFKEIIHGPCAPCLEVKGQHSHCDCTNFEAKKDCLEFYEVGIKVSGIYKLEAARFSTINAYCDQTTQGGGWTVIQRRRDGSVDFDRTWKDYRNGFGKLTSDFWFGNENIHDLTKSSNSPKKSQLLFNMKIHGTNNFDYVQYSSFEISNEQSKYTLAVSGFSGTMARDAMAYHNNKKFSTKDQDNDQDSSGNCANTFSGGWWYGNCYMCNLNGVYSFKNTDKELWYTRTTKPMFVEMKIRRNK